MLFIVEIVSRTSSVLILCSSQYR